MEASESSCQGAVHTWPKREFEPKLVVWRHAARQWRRLV